MRRLVGTAAVLTMLAATVSAQPAPGSATPAHPVDEMKGDAMQAQPGPMVGHELPVEGSPMHRMMGQQHHGAGCGMEDMALTPTQPGQSAFGAVQEIIRILEADPKTDWSKVNFDGLRQHLIDMDEVTLRADATVEKIDGGIQVAVTGQGRTLDAIRRMVPADAHHLNAQNGWTVRTTDLPDGVTLVATSTDPKQTTIIRGLGFIGVLASGTHHQEHHLMMARGEHM